MSFLSGLSFWLAQPGLSWKYWRPVRPFEFGPNSDWARGSLQIRSKSTCLFCRIEERFIIQGPRSSGCRVCNSTRQFWATGACTRQFSAILVLISTFFELLQILSSFSKVYSENVTFITKRCLSPTQPLLATNFLYPSIQTYYEALLSYFLGRIMSTDLRNLFLTQSKVLV